MASGAVDHEATMLCSTELLCWASSLPSNRSVAFSVPDLTLTLAFSMPGQDKAE